jgi:Tfp pilus assembly protein PilN
MTLGTKTVLGMLKAGISLGMRGPIDSLRRTRTALGIDISNGRINLALLKKGTSGIELLKTASGSVPEGVIKDGNIENPTALAKAIRQLETGNKMWSGRAAMSLFANPVLVQLMDMPRQIPSNIGQFVQNEVKHYVVLPGRKIAMDYCGISSEGQAGRKRLFVAATDGQKVADIAKACNKGGLNIEVIEPPLLAYARAFYAKKIAGKFDCNVLLAILSNDALTLCVFRNEIMDFVRTKHIDEDKAQPAPASGDPSRGSGPDKICNWLEEEIKAVVQFYDVEVPDSSRAWEMTVVADGAQLPEGAEESLRANVACANLNVISVENAYQDTSLGESPNIGTDKPSPVAIGLAMGLLGADGINLRINLLPAEVAEVKIVKKDALIIANIAAVVLFLMILTVGLLVLMVGKVNKNVIRTKQTELSQDTVTLLREQELLDGQISVLSGRLDNINSVLSSRHDLQWAGILNDIRRVTPRTVRITNLSSVDNSKVCLKGSALSYEAVYLFLNMLNKSGRIASASLIGTEKDNDIEGLVSYAIDCFVSPTKER